MPDSQDALIIANEAIAGRLWVGTSMYPSPAIMDQALQMAEPGFVTVSLRRQTAQQVADNGHWQRLQGWMQSSPVKLLPNTAGCHSANEAVLLAQMARELFKTDWIKLEVIGDDLTLQPHPSATVEAAKRLIDDGFKVLPYCTDDLVLCRELVDAGCPAVMPWAAPIGSGQGLLNPYQLRTLRERLADVIMVIDAGIGRPSQAMQALEMGFDAVLLNTAIAKAHDPVAMAIAFSNAVKGGRHAYQAGLMQKREMASASTPSVGLPFWQQGGSGI